MPFFIIHLNGKQPKQYRLGNKKPPELALGRFFAFSLLAAHPFQTARWFFQATAGWLPNETD
jgi:hypothetical protein